MSEQEGESGQGDGSAAVGPRAQSGDDQSKWTDTDRKNLIISFVGGLAANIGLVLILGAAIGVDRLINEASLSTRSVVYPVMAGLGIGGIMSLLFFGLYPTNPRHYWQFTTIKIVTVFYVAAVGLSLFIFLGLAAGLGKLLYFY